MEQKCIFCAIAAKQIPAKIVYEDEHSVSILDIAPRSTGMTLVIPREHLKSFDQNLIVSKQIYSSALKVSKMIRKALNPKDISMSIIPSELQHFHIRIYPVFENEVPLIENQPRKASEEELNSISERIRAVKIVEDIKHENKDVEKKEKPKTKKDDDKDVSWIKRAIQLT